MSAMTGEAGVVLTTDGLVPADQIGMTLPHERLLLDGWDHRLPNYANSLYMELVKFAAAGGRTIVDIHGVGYPRDPEFCRQVAARVGLMTVAGTGFRKDAWLPTEVRNATVDDLADILIRDITRGIDDSRIRAGVVGEVGVSRVLTPTERRTLAAAARAQRETGVGIGVHLDIGSMPAEYHLALDILESTGADLERVAVFGLVPRPDNLDLFRELVGRGCYLGFSLFGQDHRQLMADLMMTHKDVQASSIKGFVDHGFGSQILLSQSVDNIELMTANGGEGYAHIATSVLPLVKSFQVSDEQVHGIVADNPSRWLGLPA